MQKGKGIESLIAVSYNCSQKYTNTITKRSVAGSISSRSSGTWVGAKGDGHIAVNSEFVEQHHKILR